MDHIDVVLPPVAAHSLNDGCPFLAPPFKKSPEGILVSVSTAPKKPFFLHVIDISMVGMPSLSTDLINADKSYLLIVFPCSSIGDRCIHRAFDGIPGDVEKSRHLIPRQQSGPEGKYRNEGKTEGLFAHRPGDPFNLNPMLGTGNPSRTVGENHRNAPE